MRHVDIIETASLGDRSYLVHDGEVGLVVDPPRDIDRILDAADRAGVEIAWVVETHLHNDYVSGGISLCRRTGATYGHAADEDVRVPHHPLAGGDTFQVGSLSVEVLHTPGHTPHHLSYLVECAGQPPSAFTGGSLLHGSVGRTDLIDEESTDGLTRAQYRTAQHLAERLPDDGEIHPTHGFGSFCASASSDEESDGTMGREREINLALTAPDEDSFVDQLLSGLTDHPRYYTHMAPLNTAGAFAPDLSPPTPVDPAELRRRIHRGEWVVDLRDRVAYASDHLRGTVGIQLADGFSNYLGWLLPWGTAITLLADAEEDVADAQRQMVRIGIDRPAGADVGTPSSWAAEDGDRRSYPVVDFAAVAERLTDADDESEPMVVLDVRRSDEWDEGHVEGAENVPIHEILERLDDVPSDRTLWVHCASGFRASIAASLLARAGRDVVLIDDSFDAAADAGVPLSDD